MERSSPRSLGSLAGALAVWAVHFLLCYATVSLACIYGWRGARGAIAVFTGLALALLGWMGISYYRTWKAARSVAHDAPLPVFLALVAMMLCALSALALIWVALPTALLPTCAA